ncbi:chorismate mutase [Aeromonas sobria]|uniref:chorismate mutase n=1 Tax=Aeromonas sobria TaxID=646 RepID=A0A1S2CSM9_AERSO|nr:chorismate mutase [Aeromonas sobria]MBS4686809.1 chorismate mutase [Aeromonas sobria]OHY91048.1 hypothetical protein BJD16_03610 [Aeromonas sobria]
MKKMTQVEMETEVMKFLTGIEMKQHSQSPEIEFFGREPISRDISCFLQIRFSLIYLIAKSKFMSGINVEDIEQEAKVIASVKPHTGISEDRMINLMRLLISVSKNIQDNIFNEWHSNPELAPQGPFLSLDTLRLLIVDSDKEMLTYFSNAVFSKFDLMSFILDFHFSHSHLESTFCKDIKVAIFEILKERREQESNCNTSALLYF